MRRRYELPFLPKSKLLITESREEFNTLLDAIEDDIKPQGAIEQMYVHEICCIAWEILRLWRCKVAIINSAYRSALDLLITRLSMQPNQYKLDEREKLAQTLERNKLAEDLAHAWFTDEDAKKRVSQLLNQFGLDESAIEAEAIKSRYTDLERLDRLLTSLESRRNRALRSVIAYHASLAERLRESTDRIIDARSVPRLEHASGERPTAA
jgi:type IV secretory pathway VirB4 component